jgi:hypothetical protein
MYPENVDALELLKNDISLFASPAWNQGSCMVWVWGVEAMLVGLIAMHMGLQAILCARLFGYASWLDREQKMLDGTSEDIFNYEVEVKEEVV